MADRKFAANTRTSPAASEQELRELMRRFGATAMHSGYDQQTAQQGVFFRVAGRRYAVTIDLPTPAEFRNSPTGRTRTPEASLAACDQEERRRWRSLVAYIKALLVAIDDGILKPEVALLPYALLPDGQRFADVALPQLDAAEQRVLTDLERR